MKSINSSKFDTFIYEKKFNETSDFFFDTKTFGISQPYFSKIFNPMQLCLQICYLFNETFNRWSCEQEEIILKVNFD